MTAVIQVFRVGDPITWAAGERDRPAHPSDTYGEGPFTVVAVVDVPSECSYPDGYCHSGTHSAYCNVRTRESVGHPQWLIVRLPSGELALDGGTSYISGLFFAPV